MDRFLHELWNARGQLADGFLTTLEVSAASIAIGSFIGLFIGIALSFGPRPAALICRVYVDIVRGTPVMVLIFAAFYVLAVAGLQLDAFASGIVALSVFCGAHLGEILRGALQAIPFAQIENARSLGLPLRHILLLVLLPQALRLVAPVWVNTAIEIVKASTLLSIIGTGELLLKTQEIIGRTFMTMEFYACVGGFFFVICLGIEKLGRYAERRLAIPRTATTKRTSR